jgi:hypothetical protein
MTTTGIQDSTGFEQPLGSTAILDASIGASSDSEVGSFVAPATSDTAARKTPNSERPPDPLQHTPNRGEPLSAWVAQSPDWGTRKIRRRLFSREAPGVEAATEPEIDPILAEAQPTVPAPTFAKNTAIRKPAARPAAAELSQSEVEAPQQPSETIGGQGWIIERN